MFRTARATLLATIVVTLVITLVITLFMTLGAAAIAGRAMAQSIGVPVCDALLEKLEACAAKLPDDMQDDLRALNANERQLLRDLSKRDAEIICRQNQAGYRRARLHQEYGCRF